MQVTAAAFRGYGHFWHPMELGLKTLILLHDDTSLKIYNVIEIIHI